MRLSELNKLEVKKRKKMVMKYRSEKLLEMYEEWKNESEKSDKIMNNDVLEGVTEITINEN